MRRNVQRFGMSLFAELCWRVCGCHRARHVESLIVIIVPSQDNPFFKAEADAAAARARALGYRVRVDAHDDDAYRQDNLIDAAIASNAAAIILDNAGADSSIAAVRRATSAGIPCFLIDREINADGHCEGADHRGQRSGCARSWRRNLREPLGSAGGRVRGIAGTRIATRTRRCARRAFTPCSIGSRDLKLVAAQSANWSQSEAFQKTETMLQAHAEYRGNHRGERHDGAGRAGGGEVGGLQGHRDYGLRWQPGCGAAIRAGELRATALQPAVLIARLAVDEADQFLKTGSTGKPERQMIPCDLVTKDECRRVSRISKEVR